jgi:hypothetical protein
VELVPSFVELLQPFRQAMTSPTFASLLTVLAGWVLCRRRTVCGALCCGLAAGAAVTKHHSAYHRVFSAARWSLDGVGLGVLSLALSCAAAAGAAVFLVADDTLCRRRGRRVWGAGMHYDPLLTGRAWSNGNRSVKSRGHCWVVLGVVVCFPFRPGYCYCLPVLFRLCLNKKSAAAHRTAYRSRPELAREMVALACGHFPHVRFHLLADSAYAGQDTLKGLPPNCDLTARWVTNAVLHAPAAPKPPGRKGPQPKRGPRLPGPREMLEGRCERLELDVFGLRGAYRVASAEACLRTVPGRLLKVVASEPLTDGGRPRPKQRAVFYSTVASATAEQVLEWYAMRWSIEVAFRDAKQELGCGQPRCRTRDAARRCTPTLMLLYSAVVLWFAAAGHRHYRAPFRPWYRCKAAASFADMLNTLRADCLADSFLQAPAGARVSREGLQTLLSALQPAA